MTKTRSTLTLADVLAFSIAVAVTAFFLWLLFTAPGCVAGNAPANNTGFGSPHEQSAVSGAQSSGGDGWNIGAINMDGATVAVVALALIALMGFLLYTRMNGYRKTVDVLVKDNIDNGITKQQADHIQVKATAAGVEKWLKPRVEKVRKEVSGR